MTKEPNGGNGAPTPTEIPEPLSSEEFQEIRERFGKRGLPVILYVFAGPDLVKASRLMQGVGSRQIAAVATELDEWSRAKTRIEIATAQQSGPTVAKPQIIVPKR